MAEAKRSCGRESCVECPRRQLGRCHATPEQQERKTCSCGLCDLARNEANQNR